VVSKRHTRSNFSRLKGFHIPPVHKSVVSYFIYLSLLYLSTGYYKTKRRCHENIFSKGTRQVLKICSLHAMFLSVVFTAEPAVQTIVGEYVFAASSSRVTQQCCQTVTVLKYIIMEIARRMKSVRKAIYISRTMPQTVNICDLFDFIYWPQHFRFTACVSILLITYCVDTVKYIDNSSSKNEGQMQSC